MAAFDVGCSLKQDGGYEDYLRKKSMAPLAYQFSCVAPAACPENGPHFSECRRYAPAGYRIPQETEMWHQKITRGRENTERRPQTVFTGTSAYRGASQGSLDDRALAVDNMLKYTEPLGGTCKRTLMEQIPGRLNYITPFIPQVEAFQPGGIPSRCNKLAYKTNPSNAFVASAPMPPPMTVMTGVFKPSHG